MRSKKLLTIFTLLLLALPLQPTTLATGGPSQCEASLRRSVQPTTRNLTGDEDGSGSGVIISNSRVLTVYHIYSVHRNIYLNGVKRSVLKQDSKHDLVLVDFPESPLVSPVEFCDDVEVGEEVYYVGHPAGHQKSFLVFGRINAIDGDEIYSDAAALPGVSGAGLYCTKHGKLVGIVQSIYGVDGIDYPFTVAISAKVIKQFLR